MEQPALTVGLETRQKFPKEERTTFQALMGVVFFFFFLFGICRCSCGQCSAWSKDRDEGGLVCGKKEELYQIQRAQVWYPVWGVIRGKEGRMAKA